MFISRDESQVVELLASVEAEIEPGEVGIINESVSTTLERGERIALHGEYPDFYFGELCLNGKCVFILKEDVEEKTEEIYS